MRRETGRSPNEIYHLLFFNCSVLIAVKIPEHHVEVFIRKILYRLIASKFFHRLLDKPKAFIPVKRTATVYIILIPDIVHTFFNHRIDIDHYSFFFLEKIYLKFNSQQQILIPNTQILIPNGVLGFWGFGVLGLGFRV